MLSSEKYQSLGRGRRIHDQLGFASKDLEPIRGKLNLHLSAIYTFTPSLSRGTLARIEWTVRNLVDKACAGQRPPSLLNAPSLYLCFSHVSRRSLRDYTMIQNVILYLCISGSNVARLMQDLV